MNTGSYISSSKIIIFWVIQKDNSFLEFNDLLNLNKTEINTLEIFVYVSNGINLLNINMLLLNTI